MSMAELPPATVRIINTILLLLIVFADCQNPPSTGLYFMVGSQVYLPEDSVHISDIGPDTTLPRTSNAGFALVCVTTNVNTACCRNSDNNDNGARGNWYFPNNTVVPAPSADGSHFARVRYTQQVRLVSQNNHTGPLGQYRCEIPDGSRNVDALIMIINTISVNSVSITPSSQSVVAGESVVLTCSASVTGSGTITFTWSGQRSRGPESVEASRGNIYSNEFSLGTVSESDTGSYTCEVSFGTSTDSSTATISVSASTTTVAPTTPTTTVTPTTPTTTPSSVTSVVISPTNPSGTAGVSITLTCTATISGTGTPMFTWSGPSSLSQGPTAGLKSGDTYTNTFTLIVAQSYEGTITCEVQLGDSILMDSEMLSVTVPEISATLSQSRITPTALRSYILTCEISAPMSLALSPQSYTWRRNSNIVSGQNTNTLNLSPLQLSEDGARYTCQYTASSIYLSGNVIRMSSTLTLSITILPPSAPTNVNAVPQTTSVTLTWTQSSQDVITDYMISYSRTAGCSDAPSDSMTASESPYTITGLQEFTQYDIAITARNSAGTSTSDITRVTTLSSTPTGSPSIMIQSVSVTNFTVTWDRETCLDRNGRDVNYVIRLRLVGSSNVLQSGSTSVNNRIFTANSLTPRTSYMLDVALVNRVGMGSYASLQIDTFGLPFHGYLGSVSFSNNSVVNISDIELNENALYCYTNLTTCCRGTDDPPDGKAQGLWKFPDGTEVMSISNAPPSSFGRNRNKRALLLHRGNTATGPTGIYTCVIPDSSGRIQQVYFGVYNTNEGSPTVTSLTYNTTSGVLTCVSTRGPATTVTWSRSGQQSKRVVNTVMATYYNTLSIDSSAPTDYTGNFTCAVSNRRGSHSITNLYQAVGISGVEELYSIGSSAVVTCFSNFTVQSINWKDTLPSNMTAMGDLNELILTVTNIQRDLDGTVFTCEAIIILPNGLTITERNSFILRADETPPGPVDNIVIKSLTNSSLMILWEPPTMPNGIILAYSVAICKVDGNMETFNSNVSASEQNVTAFDLEPGVPYRVNVAAINSKGEGQNISNVVFTQELVPLISPKNVMISRTSGTTMTVSWTKLTIIEARGFISNYTIAYYPISGNRKRQQQNTMYKVVGSESDSVDIDGLDENSAYSVQLSASTSAGIGLVGEPMSVEIVTERSTTDVVEVTKEPSIKSDTTVIAVVVAVILAVVIVAVVVIAIVIFVSLFRRRKSSKYSPRESVMLSMRSKDTSPVKVNTNNGISSMEMEINDEEDNGEQTYENTVFLVKDRLKPVPLKDFGAHVSRMHADRDKWFEMEYSSIEKSPKFDHDVAAIPENRARNRFGNIFPYDINRVKLSIVPDVEHSDYINASYVDGYGRNKVYIAAQGPMENSVEDFWRMIWEQRTPTIVMLTRVFEGKKKCEEYWPENTSDPFIPCSGSSLVIELKSSLPFAEFVMKKMVVSKTDEPKSPSLEVVLFHYLGWPDHGVPANAISMINFIKRVRKSHPYSKEDLMVVHCSAGVGRTGTFITLDYMLERIKNEKTINIYEFVTDLRKQRVLMVQTPAQYIFIHNALDELLTCGDTEVAAANMRIIIGKLSRPAEPGASMSGFQKQFDILGKVTTDVCTLDFSQSVNAANTEKNRYEDRIPFNHTRVRLRPAAAQGSDYINASFVEGYRQKGAYIATQGPLPHTVNDFWRMIWEYECRCIVMLCKSEENGKEACRRYWPQGKGSSEMYGKLMVSLNDQKNMGEYMMRKLEISEHQPRMSVTPTGFSITQFQYLRWQEDIVPNTTATVLEIANLVQKVQMSTGNKPIIVMCNDGVGRSGTFICMHAQMERMKAEAVVDVFQFIKSVRFQRAGLVANKAQYEFCHQVLADFLDGFDTYANFKDII